MANIRRGLTVSIFLLLTVLHSAAKTAESRPLLVDKETGEPLILASITDRNGTMIALTGNDGVIPELPTNAFPVTFSYLGYKNQRVAKTENIDIEHIQSTHKCRWT